MERRDIEIFLTLAAELHFGRTAAKLRVTTARVSQTIKKLERRIGVPLFDRTSRIVTLTAVGKQLDEDLRPAFERIEESVQRAIMAGRSIRGLLRVGFGGTAPGRFLMEVADEIHSNHPACDVRIHENLFSDGANAVTRGDIDLLLATIKDIPDELDRSPTLHREPALLATSIRHPIAGRQHISMSDLQSLTVLQPTCPVLKEWDDSHVLHAVLGDADISRGPVFATTQELLALIGAGRGVFPVPLHAARFDARPDIAYIPIVDAPEFEWVFMWRAADDSERIRAFVATASALMADRQDWIT